MHTTPPLSLPPLTSKALVCSPRVGGVDVPALSLLCRQIAGNPALALSCRVLERANSPNFYAWPTPDDYTNLPPRHVRLRGPLPAAWLLPVDTHTACFSGNLRSGGLVVIIGLFPGGRGSSLVLSWSLVVGCCTGLVVSCSWRWRRSVGYGFNWGVKTGGSKSFYPPPAYPGCPQRPCPCYTASPGFSLPQTRPLSHRSKPVHLRPSPTSHELLGAPAPSPACLPPPAARSPLERCAMSAFPPCGRCTCRRWLAADVSPRLSTQPSRCSLFFCFCASRCSPVRFSPCGCCTSWLLPACWPLPASPSPCRISRTLASLLAPLPPTPHPPHSKFP